MKRFFVISVLCLFQAACSTQDTQPVKNPILLEFVDLAGEITINHEDETAVPAPPEPGNKSPVDSS